MNDSRNTWKLLNRAPTIRFKNASIGKTPSKPLIPRTQSFSNQRLYKPEMIVKYHKGECDVLHFTIFNVPCVTSTRPPLRQVREGVEDPMFERRIARWYSAKNLASDLDEASSWGAPSLRKYTTTRSSKTKCRHHYLYLLGATTTQNGVCHA